MKKLFALVFALGLVSLNGCSCTTIEPGEVGIKVDLLGEQRQVADSDVMVGRIFYNPVSTRIVTYPIRATRIHWDAAGPTDDSLSFTTNDSVKLSTDVGMTIQIARADVPKVYTKYRRSMDELLEGYIRDVVRNSMTSAASEYDVGDVLGGKRVEFQTKTENLIKEKLKDDGFVVDAFSFTSDIRPPESIKASIDQKVVATQRASEAQNKVAQIKFEAEQAVESARGKAEARRLEAEAEAKANDTISRSITPALIQYQMVQRWNGTSPQVVGGNNSSTLLSLPVAEALKK